MYRYIDYLKLVNKTFTFFGEHLVSTLDSYSFELLKYLDYKFMFLIASF